MYYSQKDLIRASVLPVLLGSGTESALLSWKIYLRTGIVSYVCDGQRHASQILAPCSKFFQLGDLSEPDILLRSLKYLASDLDYLPIIIPCNEFFRDFTKKNRDTLESKFIISDKKRFFKEKPMSVF